MPGCEGSSAHTTHFQAGQRALPERQFLHVWGVRHLGQQRVGEGEHEQVLCVAFTQVEERADGRVRVGVPREQRVEARELEVGEEHLRGLGGLDERPRRVSRHVKARWAGCTGAPDGGGR